jgi:alkanesulfonate monooxygenase SsuD/methylene tetrahydromethanopterin reductase-like flavin-dependent oxidoreductase (luciferase family)
MVRQVVIADTDEEAARIAQTAHGVWNRSILKLWHDHDDHSRDAQFGWEMATQHETILFGSPTRVREQLGRLLEVSGCNYVLCVFAWGTIPHDLALRSLRLFADEVMPAFSERAGS